MRLVRFKAAGATGSGGLDPSHVGEGAGTRSGAPGSGPPPTIAAIGLDDRDPAAEAGTPRPDEPDVSRTPRPARSDPSRTPW